ncbi:MAG: hypothetical protein ACJ74Y_16745 [Bryobacteraceae bacterium]
MDVKQYFRRLREIEESFVDKYPVVISLETPDGGKAGLVAETSRPVAAKMILEGRAILASTEQKAAYYEHQEATKRAVEKADIARRVQVAIISDPEFQSQAIAKKNTSSPSTK